MLDNKVLTLTVDYSLGMLRNEGSLIQNFMSQARRVAHTDNTHTPSFFALDAPVNEEKTKLIFN